MQFHSVDHTFLVRRAPAQSAVAGTVAAEVRCPKEFKALDPIRLLGICNDPQYVELERWVHPTKGWKLLRFTASIESYLMLHEACNAPDIEYIDVETQQHLAQMSVDLAAQHVDSYTVKELRNLAKSIGISNVSRMKKADLLAALMTVPVQDLIAAA